MHRVCTVNELYALVDRCARAEEGRLAPECAKKAEAGPTSSGGKKRPRKWSSRQALATEPSNSAGADKKAKTEVATAKPAGGGPWCPIHESDVHDARDCRSLQGIVDTRKKPQVERLADGTLGNCYNCNEPGHIARECPARMLRPIAVVAMEPDVEVLEADAVVEAVVIKRGPHGAVTMPATRRAQRMMKARGSRRPRVSLRASTEGHRH